MPRPPGFALRPDEWRNAEWKDILLHINSEVMAGRLTAELRHEEILSRLGEQQGSITSMLEKPMSKLSTSKPPRIEIPEDSPKTLQIPGGSQTVGRRYTDAARQLSEEIESAPPGTFSDGTKQHLSKSSSLPMGTKPTDITGANGKTGLAFIAHRVKSVVTGDGFEMAVAALIMANSVIMCFEVQYEGLQIGFQLKHDGINEEAHVSWPGAQTTFLFFDWLFGGLFVLEAVIKLAAIHRDYFRNYWNLVDLICVLGFVIDKIALALATEILDSKVLRLIRLFRLIRLIRLIRALENLDMLYIITTAIRGMVMIVVWAVTLLSIMLMTCALFLSQFLHSTYFADIVYETMTAADVKTRLELYVYFGTFSRCMLSMFEMTLANWPKVARLLTEEVSEWFSVICVFFKLTIGFAVVGVINGVILQETFKVASTDDIIMVRQNKRARQAIQTKMRALFEALDVDKDGELRFREFSIIAAQPDVRIWLESLDIETDDLLTLFLLLDRNGDGSLSIEELLNNIPRLRGTARGIDMMAMRKGIPSFDLQNERDPASPTMNKRLTWSESPQLSRGVLQEAMEEASVASVPSAGDNTACLLTAMKNARKNARGNQSPCASGNSSTFRSPSGTTLQTPASDP